MKPVLIAYYSATGVTEQMAMEILRGVKMSQVEVRLRRIPPLTPRESLGPLFVSKQDLIECGGLILGSPTRFGQMAACVRAFFDQTGDIWYAGQMVGKPAAVFTSSASLHGGQESTLLGMMMPLIHHGMLVTGIPYTEKVIETTQTGGGPYGASAIDGRDQLGLSEEEREVCCVLGKRMARLVEKLG